MVGVSINMYLFFEIGSVSLPLDVLDISNRSLVDKIMNETTTFIDVKLGELGEALRVACYDFHGVSLANNCPSV